MDLRALCLALLLMPAAQAADVPVESASRTTESDPHLDPEREQRGYMGAAVCAECHQAEFDLWKGSDHDHAMTEATPDTVLGDFDDAEIEAHGVKSRFFRRDSGYFVQTDGPDGELRDYPIRYTFGWSPLQQYLIEFPGGRLQALGLAWDTRSPEQGGQRWFHLYPDADPDAPMDHNNPLHWTAADQTWNYQCADCHSTDLQKRYDAEQHVYDTRYAEINVACEACHGPGARHVEWARAKAAGENAETAAATDAAGRGLLVDLKDRDGGVWQIDPETGKPARSVTRSPQGGPHVQTETCARCHSRRGRIQDELTPGDPLHQGFRLALLDPALYFPDGQIKDEVFVYGSFIQSRMYHQGVVCGDCHEPHSLDLHAEGNAVCARCHTPARYDSPEHHHHQTGSTGAACVACHMPQRYYMVVDERADHSLRVPRPDLSLKLGTPNACNACHQDKDAAWAATAVETWYPDSAYRGPHFGEALHAADTDAPDATMRLLALAADPNQPAIARASALERLRDHPDPSALMTVQRLLADPQAQVRAQAVRVLDLADLQTRVELAWPLLSDPALTVRLEAARVLAPVMTQGIGGELAERLSAALEAYAIAEMVNADRPEAHLNLGLLAFEAGETHVAEQAYRTALSLDRRFTPARVNLADLYRALGRESEAAAELTAGLAAEPVTMSERADLHFALGLAQVRSQRLDAAVEELARAAELSPQNSRYAYVYAVALDSADRTSEALSVLEAAHGKAPTDRDILIALVQYNVKLDRADAAERWLERLGVQAPDDPILMQLKEQIRARRDGGTPTAG
ncbi:tetratricopeptide repeat protein [Thiocapsa marina]|uniref:Doubled CXXCH domain protein n=1 Tax=Thiocapsa marina 5811 TaxID=768671 RepID=F9U5M6_9GAMM|nr:tetratricopeptide repeat protein [Thiocapsa marina]EGV20449.1 doubled CXXCH domain protein [Thiocapsa marina 5811]